MLRDYKELSVLDLVKYRANSRMHSVEQIDQIVASIEAFGFTNPLLIDEHNLIIAGHGRLQAAIQLNLKMVPCLVLKDLSEEQKSAYVIADNKLALNASWDIDLLRDELYKLQNADFDMSLTGFNEFEIAEIFEDTGGFIDPKEEKYESVFEIIVQCIDEAEQKQLYKDFSDKGLRCKILSM